MSHKTSGTGKTTMLFVVAVLAAMTSGCSLRNSRSQSAATPTPTPTEAQALFERVLARREAFANKKEEFTKPPAKVQLTTEPYIKGKAAFYHSEVKPEVQKDEWVLDNFLGAYPDEMPSHERAIRPITARAVEEVETVLLQKCQKVRKGSYTVEGMKEKIPGYAWSCELTMIDRTIPAIVYRKTFEGDLPYFKSLYGNVDTKTETVVSPLPQEAIDKFVTGLPRK